MQDNVEPQPRFSYDGSLAEATLRNFFRNHWTTFYFGFGLLVHIGCLVLLQLTETNSKEPPVGTQRTMQKAAGYAMYLNVVLMVLMVLLDSHLYVNRRLESDALKQLEEDFDLPSSESEAKAELRFISKFSKRIWRPVMQVIGQLGQWTLTLCGYILILAVLATTVSLFFEPGTVPIVVEHTILYCLSIPGLLCLLAGLLVVLHRMYCKYYMARQRVSRMVTSTALPRDEFIEVDEESDVN